MRIALDYPLNLVSITRQAELLRRCLERDHEVWRLFERKGLQSCDYLILHYPMFPDIISTPLFKGLTVGANRRIFYGVVEGRPNVIHASYRMLRCYEIIVPSHYAMRKLQEAGVAVHGVVPNAIDLDESDKALQNPRDVKGDLDRRVVFAYCGSSFIRKRVDKLLKAFKMAYEKVRDIGLVSVSVISAEPELKEGIPLREFYPYGQAPHYELMRIIAGADFFIWPSVCEGFGVPPLEAMSLAKPVIACRFEPNTEFMDDDFTLFYPYQNVVEYNYSDIMMLELHEYDEKELADMILQAYDIYMNNPSQYEDMKLKARSKAESYDYRLVYPAILT